LTSSETIPDFFLKNLNPASDGRPDFRRENIREFQFCGDMTINEKIMARNGQGIFCLDGSLAYYKRKTVA